MKPASAARLLRINSRKSGRSGTTLDGSDKAGSGDARSTFSSPRSGIRVVVFGSPALTVSKAARSGPVAGADAVFSVLSEVAVVVEVGGGEPASARPLRNGLVGLPPDGVEPPL